MVEEDVLLLLSLINYAETLVGTAEDESVLRTAVEALATVSPVSCALVAARLGGVRWAMG